MIKQIVEEAIICELQVIASVFASIQTSNFLSNFPSFQGYLILNSLLDSLDFEPSFSVPVRLETTP